MASTLGLKGKELKEMLALAKKKPLGFGYCPGKKPSGDVFIMHRTHDGQKLSKQAKAEGEGSKVAFGSAEVKGKLLTLTCTKELSGLAKRLKTFLKSENAPHNVRILDKDGKVLEEDIQDTDGDAADAPQAADVAAPPQAPAPSPKLEQAAKVLGDRIAALGDDARKAKLMAAHTSLLEHIKAGNTDKATNLAKSLNQALSKMAAPASQTAQDPAQPSAAQNPTEWRAARAELEAQVLDMLAKGYGDPSKLRAAWGIFMQSGEAGDYAKAIKTVPALRKLLALGEASEQSAAEADIPVNLVPFVKARLTWAKTRRALNAEIAKLRAAILSKCAKLEGFDGLETASLKLFTYLDVLDARLETTLEEMVITPDGAKRIALKDQAASIIKEYKSHLDQGFFSKVDGDNGFTKVNIRGAAIAALTDVESTVAAPLAA